MNPTRAQLYWASRWPERLWCGSFSVGGLLGALLAWDPPLAALTQWRSIPLLLLIAPSSMLLALIPSLMLAGSVCPPINAWRVRRNGGPFNAGDLVLVLSGPHRGRVARVC